MKELLPDFKLAIWSEHYLYNYIVTDSRRAGQNMYNNLYNAIRRLSTFPLATFWERKKLSGHILGLTLLLCSQPTPVFSFYQ